MDSYNKIKQYLQDLESDAMKFYDKGQAAAGTRLRKGLSELKKMAQDMRNEIQDLKNHRKEDKQA